MLLKYKLRLFFLIVIFLLPVSNFAQIITGTDRIISESQNLITGKNIGVVCNHTALLSNGAHLVDTLINLPNVSLKAIFTPEHGFKGSAEAGELINKKSLYKKVSVISLYGSERKPSKENLKDIDLLIFDIQDVGARFYTYISTLYNVVEAAGENNIPIIVLDRPNPIGGKYFDGPVLDENFKSFVGIAPIPITHGMTVGELATFFVGEKLINNSDKVALNVVKCKNWHREIPNQFYSKWVPPSPNINHLETAFVYPGICLLEGTNISEGRGTQFPFLQFGAPFINSEDVISKLNLLKVEGAELQAVSFIPEDIDGMATNPKFKGQTCNGIKVKVTDPQKFESVKFGVKLLYVLNKLYGSKLNFTGSFDRLAGNSELRELINKKTTPDKIFGSWQKELTKFEKKRINYLLY